MGVSTVSGTGGYHTGEKWQVWSPSPRPAGAPLVVICHGAGGSGHYYGEDSARSRHLRWLARTGLLVVAADLGTASPGTPIDSTWGGPRSVEAVDEVIDWAGTRWGIDTTRVSLLGDSAGGATALNWARANPSRVAGVALRAGVADVESIYQAGAGNALLVDLIDQAYWPAGYGGLDLPGGSGNYASTPDEAALDITGDIDLRVDLTAPDWTPSVFQTLIAKYRDDGTNQRSYRLGLQTSGRPQLTTTSNGSTLVSFQSTVAPTVTDGARMAVRVTLDVDNGASGRTATFYTAPTITGPWVQLGDPVTQAGTTSIFSGAAVLEVGSNRDGAVNNLIGRVHAAEIRDGIDGTVVASPKFGYAFGGLPAVTDPTGRTWTANGTAEFTRAWSEAGADHDPAQNTAEFDGLENRIRLYYSLNDGLVPAAGVVAFAETVGCRAIPVGAVDHDMDTWFDRPGLAAWFWDRYQTTS